jgi:hypothetical protein
MDEELKVKSKWTMRRKLLVTFALLIGVVMVVILPGVFWELHEANSALHGFSDALIAKQYARAYDLTSQELRASTDFSAFVKVHDGLTVRFGDLKKIDVNQSNVKDQKDGWYATINAHMIFARGSLPFVFILKKDNESWKIYSYHEE